MGNITVLSVDPKPTDKIVIICRFGGRKRLIELFLHIAASCTKLTEVVDLVKTAYDYLVRLYLYKCICVYIRGTPLFGLILIIYFLYIIYIYTSNKTECKHEGRVGFSLNGGHTTLKNKFKPVMARYTHTHI